MPVGKWWRIKIKGATGTGRGKVLSAFLCPYGGLLYPVEVFNELPKPLTLLFLHSLMERVLLWQSWNFGAIVVRLYAFGGTTFGGLTLVMAKHARQRKNASCTVRKPENCSPGFVFSGNFESLLWDANRVCVFSGGSTGLVLRNWMTKLVLVTQPLWSYLAGQVRSCEIKPWVGSRRRCKYTVFARRLLRCRELSSCKQTTVVCCVAHTLLVKSSLTSHKIGAVCMWSSVC